MRSELEYQFTLKAEVEIMRLHEKVDRLSAMLLAQRPVSPAA